jgi:8-oxo-dGTP pyrophosphatase MutT (NUDIX family)
VGEKKFQHTKPDKGPPKKRVRLLLVDDLDRVFMVQARDWYDMQSVEWQLPGGKIKKDDDGRPIESMLEAAERELREESGYAPTDLAGRVKGPIWICKSRRNGHDREDYVYIAHLKRGAKQKPVELSKTEKKTMLGHRWWTLGDLIKSDERFRPRRIVELFGDFLAQGTPKKPRRINE